MWFRQGWTTHETTCWLGEHSHSVDRYAIRCHRRLSRKPFNMFLTMRSADQWPTRSRLRITTCNNREVPLATTFHYSQVQYSQVQYSTVQYSIVKPSPCPGIRSICGIHCLSCNHERVRRTYALVCASCLSLVLHKTVLHKEHTICRAEVFGDIWISEVTDIPFVLTVSTYTNCMQLCM